MSQTSFKDYVKNLTKKPTIENPLTNQKEEENMMGEYKDETSRKIQIQAPKMRQLVMSKTAKDKQKLIKEIENFEKPEENNNNFESENQTEIKDGFSKLNKLKNELKLFAFCIIKKTNQSFLRRNN